MTSSERWILYNNVEWKRTENRRSWNHCQPHQRLVFIQRRWCVYVGLEVSPLLWAPFGKPISSNKYCSHIDQVKATLDRKCLESVNRKCIIFHQDNSRPHVSLMTRQELLQLDWKVLIHCHIHQILHLWMSIYFSLYKILLMEKMSIPWMIVKDTWNSSLLKKIQSFGKVELWDYLKNGRR